MPPLRDDVAVMMRVVRTIAAIVLALAAGWMFRYEPLANGALHVNRFTGAVCRISEACWFNNDIYSGSIFPAAPKQREFSDEEVSSPKADDWVAVKPR